MKEQLKLFNHKENHLEDNPNALNKLLIQAQEEYQNHLTKIIRNN